MSEPPTGSISRDERGLVMRRERVVELASNENPLGPSPRAIEALRRELATSHRYPEVDAGSLRARLADRAGVHPDTIFAGPGSTALIDLLARVLLGPGTSAVVPAASFLAYGNAVDATGARRIAPARRDGAIDLDAVADAVAPDTRLLFLANPDNPTGTTFGPRAFDTFLDRLPGGVTVVLDEAYAEYAEGLPDGLAAVRAGRPVVVLRTFSKVYGLAALRVGWGAASPGMAAELRRRCGRYPVAGPGLAAAEAALDDVEHVRRSVRMNEVGRERLWRGLAALGLRPLRSAVNFVYVELDRPADPVAAELLAGGVRVRALGPWGAPEALRIGVGRPEDVDRVLRALA